MSLYKDMKLLILFSFVLITLILYVRIYHPITCLSAEQKQHLYGLMERVDIVLKNNNIPYFIICGTLLGSVRHGEIIPWDNDIDIGIMKKDLPRLQAIDWEAYGLGSKELAENQIGKLFFPEHYGNGDKFKSVFIDVFVFEQVGDRIQYTYDYARDLWPREYFLVDEVFPLRSYTFGELTVQGPAQYEPYCERAWGNWRAYPMSIYWKVLFHPEKIDWILRY